MLSLAVVWLLGAVFLTSPTVCEWDEHLEIPIPAYGTKKQVREENWNTFTYGAMGLEEHDAQRAASSGEKLLIFGDSYIEADMVKPNERVQARLTEMGFPCVGVGVSGNSCVEYYHLMGIYNCATPNVTADILLIADISDILPPTKTTDFTSLKHMYPFRRQEGRLGEFSYRFHLMAFRNLLKRGKTAWQDGLDLTGNHWREQTTTYTDNEDTSHYETYWHNMLAALKSQAPNGRLMIVYVPIVPRIRDNAIDISNDYAELMRRFTAVCNEYGLIGGGIINLERRLCDYTASTHRFPRGFFNTRPGEGHLNGEGHRLVAEAIVEVLRQ